MQNKRLVLQLLPLLFGFFIMGFCDLVGISVTYAQLQFNWSETQAGFLPSLVFLWFFIVSIPVAVKMEAYGRKKMVLLALLFTLLATLIPIIWFNEVACYITFILLGVGNTILQVSLNPLLTNVVNQKQLTSYITLGQFIKAISSFTGPLIVGFFSLRYGSWEKSFYVYTVITLLSFIWLLNTRIEEHVPENKTVGFSTTLGLLKHKTILLSFIGILCIVGVDVGMNTLTPKLLMERAGLAKEAAAYGASWYFAARTVGTVCGVFILSKFSKKGYFIINILIVILSLMALLFANGQGMILFLVCIIAFCSSSIFSVIYTLAIMSKPQMTNEISGLMITGVAGGAVVPPLMGIASEITGSQQGAIGIILLCSFYLAFSSFTITTATK